MSNLILLNKFKILPLISNSILKTTKNNLNYNFNSFNYLSLSLTNKSFERSFYTNSKILNNQTSSNPSTTTTTTNTTPIKEAYENIYTIPNALTLTRIAACPVIGYYVLQGELGKATLLLFFAGLTDLADGYLARKYNMGTVLGSILDPAADKLLMTTMVVTLAMKGMLPLPLAGLIIGRDVLLSFSAFYFRYISLPAPKTFTRYWDFSIPSAEVKPTEISKYNTALQLALVGATTVLPLLPIDLTAQLLYLQWGVAGTTIASGLSYVFSKKAVKFIR